MAQEAQIKTPAVSNEIAGARKDIDIFQGYLNRLENPDPTLRTEAAGKGLKLYDEVDRDPHAGAVLQSRYLSVVSKEWEVLPGKESRAVGRPGTRTKAQVVAEFVQTALESTNFDQARQELLQAVLYGFYVAEIIWTVRDGDIVPARIRAKHPRRFSFTMDRGLRLLTPQSMIEGEPVPVRKFIRFTYGSSDNPYGKGLGQKLWWPVWFKKNGIKFWLVFLEKFGMPTTVGKYPPGTPIEQQQALLDAIDAIQNETGVKIPDSMAIELLEATRAGNVTHESLCNYMDKQISKAVLGQTATTEGTPGKLGDEQSQAETKKDIVAADAGLLDECLNKSLVRWIVDFNFPGVTSYPRIHIRTEPEKDLKPLSERDKILVSDIGVPVSRKYFYDTYGIPEPDKEEVLVSPEPPRRGAGDFTEGSNRHDSRFSQADVDNLAAQAAKEAQGAVSGLLEPIEDLISGAASFEEIGSALYNLYPEMDASQFRDLLARAMFAAGLTGYGAAKDDEVRE